MDNAPALERKLADIDQRIDGLHLLRGELTRRPGADMQACPLQGAAT
ncbi:hypothetical protein [Duganella margarita]|nr:hypothetical protein [Duganella margarita]